MRVVTYRVLHTVVAGVAAGLRATGRSTIAAISTAATGEVLVGRGDEVEADCVADQEVGVSHPAGRYCPRMVIWCFFGT